LVREILFYGEIVLDFYKSQPLKVQIKIEYVLDLVRFERQVPKRFFKKLEGTNGLYEVRVITSQNSIRILCFLDQEKLVVLTNAFVKKSQKTPKKEMERAQRLRLEYLKRK
jgi:phage-related protein